MWAAAVEQISIPGLQNAHFFADNAARVANRSELTGLLGLACMKWTKADLLAQLYGLACRVGRSTQSLRR